MSVCEASLNFKGERQRKKLKNDVLRCLLKELALITVH